MAVRVVKLKPESDEVREVICPNCRATLEYVSVDVKAAYESKYALMASSHYWIVCANKECGKDVKVPSMCW